MIDAEAAVAVVLVARMPAPLRGERERSYAPATSIQSDDLKISWEESARLARAPARYFIPGVGATLTGYLFTSNRQGGHQFITFLISFQLLIKMNHPPSALLRVGWIFHARGTGTGKREQSSSM